jgi:hypothetical protein
MPVMIYEMSEKEKQELEEMLGKYRYPTCVDCPLRDICEIKDTVKKEEE